jgi:hypothetical protein
MERCEQARVSGHVPADEPDTAWAQPISTQGRAVGFVVVAG